ncbi:hypothetical protein BKA62DRAFT_717376 [Auriculariales sp. MPI-PUGE-AT-0066]|nr:hypothetical protein BKA62DRAFT_717376 [Auriculariales sp. MPI-PUGE-AT-0066]
MPRNHHYRQGMPKAAAASKMWVQSSLFGEESRVLSARADGSASNGSTLSLPVLIGLAVAVAIVVISIGALTLYYIFVHRAPTDNHRRSVISLQRPPRSRRRQRPLTFLPSEQAHDFPFDNELEPRPSRSRSQLPLPLGPPTAASHSRYTDSLLDRAPSHGHASEIGPSSPGHGPPRPPPSFLFVDEHGRAISDAVSTPGSMPLPTATYPPSSAWPRTAIASTADSDAYSGLAPASDKELEARAERKQRSEADSDAYSGIEHSDTVMSAGDLRARATEILASLPNAARSAATDQGTSAGPQSQPAQAQTRRLVLHNFEPEY